MKPPTILCVGVAVLSVALAQDHKTAGKSGDLVAYVTFDAGAGNKRKVQLRLVTPEGTALGSVELTTYPGRLRSTPGGTIITISQNGILEMDRNGKVVREQKPSLWPLSCVHRLENGNCIVVKNERKSSVIAEIDRDGKVVRQIDVKIQEGQSAYVGGAQMAWPSGKDRVLVIGSNRVVEIDWTGKTHFELKPEGFTYVYDAAALPNGHVIVAGATPGRGKTGKVAEFDRQGNEIWSGSHGCPVTVQPLHNGNVLVGAG